MSQPAPRLAMTGLSKRFGATQALQDVDLELRAGEVHALVGENGAGKSTLMKLLSGALRPDSGEMRLDGAPYAPRDPAEGRAAGVAMIYQELSLAPHLSVAENLFLGAEQGSGLLDLRAQRREAQRVLGRLGLASLDQGMPAGRLSPALQQMVEIGRALASGCRVLVLDEPTSSLGQGEQRTLFALIKELAAQGVAIAYISHFLEEVRQISDRLTVLRDGKRVAQSRCAESSNDQIVTWMVGRKVSELYHHSIRRPGEVLLEVQDLAGNGLPVSAGLQLRRGEVLGIAGLMGSGRSELLRTIQGLEPVVSGSLRVVGVEGSRTVSERWAQGQGMVSEDRKGEGLALGLSVAENLCLARLGAYLSSPADIEARGQAGVSALGIKCDSPGQECGELSGGNQQKVALARLLDADCDILLLDEPTRGIDVGAKAEVFRLIDELASGARARAVLMVSSYLPDLLGACDRIAVMHKGRLGLARPVDELDEHKLLMEATGAAMATE